MKTIGSCLIDTGMVKASGIKQELWRVKDWADDLIVLKLYSSETVFEILKLKGPQDLRTIAITCLTLFFQCVHLVAVNCKDKLKASERVTMIWHSFLWLIHVDGVSVTTKRNFLSECVSFCFLIMRDDVTDPHLLTTEPSEHSNALLRCMQREFTVKDFLVLVNKMHDRTWKAMTIGELSMARKAHGYASTLAACFTKQHPDPDRNGENVRKNRNSGPVNVILSELLPSTSAQIWKELEPILSASARSMTILLQRVCDAKELHPMIALFDQNSSLSDLIERCEAMYKHSSDTSLFKKEMTDHIQLGQQDMTASPELDQPASRELGIGTDPVKFSVNDLNGFNRERDRLINAMLSEDNSAIHNTQ